MNKIWLIWLKVIKYKMTLVINITNKIEKILFLQCIAFKAKRLIKCKSTKIKKRAKIPSK